MHLPTNWALIIPPCPLFLIPSLLSYLLSADVHEPPNGIMEAFLRNQRERAGVLGD